MAFPPGVGLSMGPGPVGPGMGPAPMPHAMVALHPVAGPPPYPHGAFAPAPHMHGPGLLVRADGLVPHAVPLHAMGPGGPVPVVFAPAPFPAPFLGPLPGPEGAPAFLGAPPPPVPRGARPCAPPRAVADPSVAQASTEGEEMNLPESDNPEHYMPTDKGPRLITKSRLRRILLDDIKAELTRRGYEFPEGSEFWRKDRWVSEALGFVYKGAYHREARQWRTEEDVGEEDKARQSHHSNATGLQLVFMGTSVGPCSSRGLPTLAARLSRQVLMFGAAEDTQRRFPQSLVTPYRVSRVFVPSRNPLFYLGLPGLICTVSATRSGGTSSIPTESEARTPLRIYAPPGVLEYVHTTLDVSNTYVSIPVIVYELVDGPVTEEEARPQLVNPRCRLFRARRPRDGGWGGVTPMTEEEEEDMLLKVSYSEKARASFQTKKEVKDRSVFRPFPDVSEASSVPEATTWTFDVEKQWRVVCSRGASGEPGGMTFALVEAAKAGKADLEKCVAAGIAPGPQIMRLKQGESVINDQGDLVTPEQVVAPDVAGRKIVIAIDRPHKPSLEHFLDGATAAVHTSSVVRPVDAFLSSDTLPEDEAVCREAGRACARAGVKQLVMTNFRVPQSVKNAVSVEEGYMARLRAAVESEYSGQLTLADDLAAIDVDCQDADEG